MINCAVRSDSITCGQKIPFTVTNWPYLCRTWVDKISYTTQTHCRIVLSNYLLLASSSFSCVGVKQVKKQVCGPVRPSGGWFLGGLASVKHLVSPSSLPRQDLPNHLTQHNSTIHPPVLKSPRAIGSCNLHFMDQSTNEQPAYCIAAVGVSNISNQTTHSVGFVKSPQPQCFETISSTHLSPTKKVLRHQHITTNR